MGRQRTYAASLSGGRKLQPWVDEWRERIAVLYRLHGARQELSPGTQGYQEADEELHRFVKEEIEVNWRAQLTDRSIPLAGRDVLKTVQRHWEGLTRFLDNPELPLDNNAAERLLRTPVVGRKNFYGSGSKWSGEFGAMMWTITATVARAKLNPLAHLTDYLTACANNHGKPLEGPALDRFLPWMMSEAEKKAWAFGEYP